MPDNFNELFENEKARLNPQQAAAVNAIEGPILVIAGPGTGKTQVLSLRIANILALTDTQPENILCLTYTDNAAYNMRQRLIKIMGSTAYKINVFTFHSLANYIFQENSMFFENKDIPIINKLEEVLFMRELVDDLIKKHRNQHPLTQIKDPYHYIKPLIYLFENIKRENFNPAELINNINHCINDLPNQADFIYKKNSGTNKKGDINYRKLNEATETYKKLEAAISCFELYQNKLKTKARCNFDDLINWVIELLQSHETIRNSYQERFQYILIDEFQDTNGSQYKLMEQLTNFWEKPNLFVVGDDDQSIFRFQGANIENMVHFIQQYITHPPQEVFCLIHNYRSSQQLINSSKTLISNNSERLINNASFNKFELNKDFIAANPLYNQSQLLPIYTLYHTIDDEYIDVVQKIKDLILIDKTPPHEIAVLYKENKIGIELQEYFKVENLPFHCSVDIDILNEPTIKQVIKIFRYVLDETNIKKAFQNDRLLFEILHFRFFNLSLVEIGEVFLQYNQIKNADNNFIHFRYFLMLENKILNEQNINQKSKLLQAFSILENLILNSQNQSILHTLSQILSQCGILNYCLTSKNYVLLDKIKSFIYFITNEVNKNPEISFTQMIELIELTEQEKIPILYSESNPETNAVQLMTIHKSKGLEFKYVFIIQCSSKLWEEKRKSNSFKIPTQIISNHSNQVSESENQEEIRRLFYVGITRAKQQLFLSSSKLNDQQKEITVSKFIIELFDKEALLRAPVIISQEQKMKFFANKIAFNEQIHIQLVSDNIINDKLSKLSLSHTLINSFIECPLVFYYEHLLKVPRPPDHHLSFGTVIHKALEDFFKECKKYSSLQSLDLLLTFYDKALNYIFKPYFTVELYVLRLEYGKEILTQYYNRFHQEWHWQILIEEKMELQLHNEILLKAKFDKIEMYQHEIKIIDYKTGNFMNSKEKVLEPDFENVYGGSFWRQANIYGLLYKLKFPNFSDKLEVSFNFIEPDKNTSEFYTHHVYITSESLKKIETIIADVWQKIQRKEFEQGCGKETCYWCNLIKDRN